MDRVIVKFQEVVDPYTYLLKAMDLPKDWSGRITVTYEINCGGCRGIKRNIEEKIK